MNSRVSGLVVPLVAVVVYILIDLCYVFLAKNRYAEVVKNIQKGEEINIDIVAAIACYTLMAVGWYSLTVQLAFAYYNTIKQKLSSLSPLAATSLSGLVAGFIYGLVVYGVYNLTTRTIFGGQYPMSLLLQDMAWGTLYNMVFTAIYMTLWRKLTDPIDL